MVLGTHSFFLFKIKYLSAFSVILIPSVFCILYIRIETEVSAMCFLAVAVPDRRGCVQQGRARDTSPQCLLGRECAYDAADIQSGSPVHWLEGRRGGCHPQH